ncbi:MAG: DUF411 domain-containing protein [Vibrio sp.]
MNKLNLAMTIGALTFASNVFAASVIDLYKSPSCGCCTEWAEIMQQKGYEVKTHQQQSWNEVKSSHGLTPDLVSCHSAVIDGYLIEGHVPEADIARLLKEKPKGVKGLAAPGMPQHSPGMAAPGVAYQGFDVIAFGEKGQSVYASY